MSNGRGKNQDAQQGTQKTRFGGGISTSKLVLSGLISAVIFLATFLLKFPVTILPGAYVHAGDGVIFFAGALLGGPLGAICAAIGSALADLAAGSLIYIVPTLITKALMGFAAGVLLKDIRPFKEHLVRMVPIVFIMLVGYFIADLVLWDVGMAFVGLWFNAIQGVASVAIGALLLPLRDSLRR